MLDLTRLAPSLGPIPLWHIHLPVNHVASDLMDEQMLPRTLHGPTTPVPRVTNSAEVTMVTRGRQDRHFSPKRPERFASTLHLAFWQRDTPEGTIR